MKLSVNVAKLAGLRARNCTTIQQVLILKFAFGPEKFSAAFEKQATGTTHYEALRTSAWEATKVTVLVLGQTTGSYMNKQEGEGREREW